MRNGILAVPRWWWPVIAAAMLSAFLIGIYAAMPHAMAGQNLRVFAGTSPDSHLLTGWLWQHVSASAHYAAAVVQGYNVAAFAVFLCCVVLLLVRCGVQISLAAVAIVALAVSPAAIALFAGPLGAEDAVSAALFACTLFVMYGRLTLPQAVAALIPVALVLQAPLDGLAACYCAIVVACRYPIAGAVSLAGVAGAIALHAHIGTLANPMLGIDPGAGPITVLALAVLLFIVGPALLLLRQSPRIVSLTAQSTAPAHMVVLGILAMIGGLFAPGDPTPQWFALETAALLAIVVSLRDERAAMRAGVACMSAVAIVSILAIPKAMAAVPTAKAAVQMNALLHAHSGQQSGPLCVITSGSQADAVAVSAFLKIYMPGFKTYSAKSAGDCLKRNTAPAIVYVARGEAQWWPAVDNALVRAAAVSQDAAAQPVSFNSRTRDSRMGGFGGVVDTASGPVHAFTILAGHAYRARCSAQAGPAVLSFAVQNPLGSYRGAQPARLEIRDTASSLVFSRTILPGKPTWVYAEAHLRKGNCEGLEFRATAPDGNAVAAWVRVAGVSVRPLVHSHRSVL